MTQLSPSTGLQEGKALRIFGGDQPGVLRWRELSNHPVGEGSQLSYQVSKAWGPKWCRRACVCNSHKHVHWGAPPPYSATRCGTLCPCPQPCLRAVDGRGPWVCVVAKFPEAASLASPLPLWTFPPVTGSWTHQTPYCRRYGEPGTSGRMPGRPLRPDTSMAEP